MYSNRLSLLVDAALVGPQELGRTIENEVVSREGGFEPFCEVATAFQRGLKRCDAGGITSSALEQVTRAGEETVADQDTAALAFARVVRGLPSGYYALGCSAIAQTWRGERGRKAHSVGVPPSHDERRDRNRERVGSANYGLGSEKDMIAALTRVSTLSPETCSRYLRHLGVDRNRDVLESLKSLWMDRAESQARRVKALQVWSSSRPPGKLVDETLFLFDLAFTDADPKIREEARCAFVRLLGHATRTEQLNLPYASLRSIRNRLSNAAGVPSAEKVAWLGVWGGIMARYSDGVLSQPSYPQAQMVIEAALGFLDMALSPNEPDREVKEIAYAHGLWAVEAFVPHGAQIMYDWTRWRVRGETNPEHAAFIAFVYMHPFTGVMEADGQQRSIGYQALRRRDLSADRRDALWAAMRDDAGPLTLLSLWWRRRFGRTADPRVVASAS